MKQKPIVFRKWKWQIALGVCVLLPWLLVKSVKEIRAIR